MISVTKKWSGKLINAREAQDLVQAARIDNKIKRLEQAKERYVFILEKLDTLIRDCCTKGYTGITLPFNDWPKEGNVDYEELGELLQESYGFKCVIVDDGERRGTGLRIRWN